MIPYLINIILTACFAFLYEKSRGKMSRLIFLLFSVVPIILLAGFRDYSIGTDTQQYVVRFIEVSQYPTLTAALHNYTAESLYVCWTFLVSRLTTDPHIFLLLTQCLIIMFLIWAMMKMKISIAWGLFIYLTLYYCQSFNAVRQVLAMAACLVAFPYMLQRKWVKMLVLLVVAYGFHNTAIIFLGVPGLWFLLRAYRRLAVSRLYKLIFVALFVFATTRFLDILQILGGAAILDEKYMNRYGSADIYGSGLPLATFALTIFNLLWFYHYAKINDLQRRGFYEYLFLIPIITCLLGYYSTYAPRIGDYFIFLSIILFPLFGKQIKFKAYRWGLILFYMFYWSMITMRGIGEVYPYRSVVLGI